MTLPQFTLIDNRDDAVTASRAEAVIIGTVQGEDGVEVADGAQAVDAAFDGTLTEVLSALGAKGKADEVVKIPTFGRLTAPVVVAAGLGKRAEGGVTAEQVRRASGAAARALNGASHALTTLSAIDLQASVEGTALGAYTFTEYKSEPNGHSLTEVEVLRPVSGEHDEHRNTLTAASAIASAVALARDLVNTPPNELFPASFADRAREQAEAEGLSVEVLDEKDLERGRYGGILGVGGGSARKPRLVRLRYRGERPVAKVALVGKGITFDTGGISIKPAANMENMTSDMAGAAAVLATAVLAAKLRYPLEVTAYLPLAENMPSATAYRPGDVLEMYGGKTVEVINTDAEGRLVLADAIVRAAEDDPDYLIETSTLTGAQPIALGNRTAGVMGSDEFRDRVADVARRTGEGGWAMPLPEELRADLDSRVADIANVTGNRWGGMLVAGVFLREFVAENLPWAHIDVAGPAYNTTSAWGYTGKGGTGVPVRTLAAVLAEIAGSGD
ncbi:leucyl aminopeptidase [Haloechinothrix sp. LS1_15]|uniref:leucyl aminopeptidase n=1 Tax=Haloechinothrix sp. LS1_15 TaxID=2652248 RepID=UPI002944C418|nr:leucyl aminopeptidase [Haloechinothrix sp. LS1_15]MDV6012725.1 leucyl aminopeptidase [Haloechinothrix sp. LS1_15]